MKRCGVVDSVLSTVLSSSRLFTLNRYRFKSNVHSRADAFERARDTGLRHPFIFAHAGFSRVVSDQPARRSCTSSIDFAIDLYHGSTLRGIVSGASGARLRLLRHVASLQPPPSTISPGTDIPKKVGKQARKNHCYGLGLIWTCRLRTSIRWCSTRRRC